MQASKKTNASKGGKAGVFDHHFGTRGDDLIDSGTGNDLVLAGKGDDTVLHHEEENADAINIYNGGQGVDTLLVTVTRATYESEAFQTDLERAQSSSHGSGGANGYFKSLGFFYISFESIEIEILNSSPVITVEDPVPETEGNSGDTDIAILSVADYLTIADPDGDDTQLPYAGNLDLQSTTGPEPTGGLASLFVVDPDNGTISYDRADFDYLQVGEAVTATFSFDAASGPDTLEQTITVTITGENEAPITPSVDLGTIAVEGERVITAAELLDVSSDAEGDSMTLVSLAIAYGGGELLDNNDGTWTYTGAQGDGSAVTLSYEVTDGQSVSTGSAFLNINFPVEAASVDLGDILEDGERIITQAEILAGAYDEDGPLLEILSVDLESVEGDLAPNGDGTWTFTPEPDWYGEATFGYEVSDGYGTASATATLDVASVNDAPVASDISITIDEDSSFAPLVLFFKDGDLDPAIVSDVDDDIAFIGFLTPEHGAILAFGDHWSSPKYYVPEADYFGTDSFEYQVFDEYGDYSSATVTVTILPVQDDPVAVSEGLLETDEDTPITIDVLANDYDVDGDDLSILLANSTMGKLVINDDDTLTFTPDPDYLETGSYEIPTDVYSVPITYTITDGNGGISSTNFVINVLPINDAPVVDQGIADQIAAVDDSFSFLVPEDAFDDVDDDTLTYYAELSGGEELPSWLGFDGSEFSGSPTDADFGTYDIAVTATDPDGLMASTTFSITVGETSELLLA